MPKGDPVGPDMPDLLSETLMTLNKARELLPGRGSAHPDLKTVKGWVKAGKLEATKIGGT